MNTFRRSYQVSRKGAPSLHLEIDSDNPDHVSIGSVDRGEATILNNIHIGDLQELVAVAATMVSNEVRERRTCTTTEE